MNWGTGIINPKPGVFGGIYELDRGNRPKVDIRDRDVVAFEVTTPDNGIFVIEVDHDDPAFDIETDEAYDYVADSQKDIVLISGYDIRQIGNMILTSDPDGQVFLEGEGIHGYCSIKVEIDDFGRIIFEGVVSAIYLNIEFGDSRE